MREVCQNIFYFEDSALIRENTGQRKHAFRHILRSDSESYILLIFELFNYCFNENYRFSLNLLVKYVLKTTSQGKKNMEQTHTYRESPDKWQKFTKKFTRCCKSLLKNELYNGKLMFKNHAKWKTIRAFSLLSNFL